MKKIASLSLFLLILIISLTSTNSFVKINAIVLKRILENNEFYVIDTREMSTSVLGYISNTVIIPRSNFTSWFSFVVPENAKLVVITDRENYIQTLVEIESFGKYKLYGYCFYDDVFRFPYFNIEKIEYDPNTKESLSNIIPNKGSLIIDVREISEYKETGVIEEAQLIPFSTFIKNYVNIPNGRRIYVLCKKGLRAVIAATFAQRAGLTNKFIILYRGIEKVIEEGYPLVPYKEK